jgi:hypothetical protein
MDMKNVGRINDLYVFPRGKNINYNTVHCVAQHQVGMGKSSFHLKSVRHFTHPLYPHVDEKNFQNPVYN